MLLDVVRTIGYDLEFPLVPAPTTEHDHLSCTVLICYIDVIQVMWLFFRVYFFGDLVALSHLHKAFFKVIILYIALH